jgi:putative radical SAM-modified peptide
METDTKDLEILDEGKENADEVPACCPGSVTRA